MKFKPLLLSLTLAAMPVSISSAIDMKDLFDSYSRGAAGTYQTSDGTTFYGGNFTTRAKLVEHDIINVNPPSIKAGCNGIDFYAGSFSLISGDEVVQMARGIAQGAAGYFFNMAVGSICASCLDNMREMASRLEELNKFSQNSCQNFWDKMTDAEGRAEEKAKNADKAAVPLLDAWSGTALGWADSVVKKADSFFECNKDEPGCATSDAAKKVVAGNVFTEKLKTSFSDLNLVFPGFTTEQEKKELFISLFGTLIIPLDGKPKAIHPIENLLVDFFNGQAEVKINRCLNLECTDVEQREVENFASLYDYHLAMVVKAIKTIKRKGNIDNTLQEYMLANDFNYSKAAQSFNEPQIETLGRVLAAQIASQQLMDAHEQFVTLLYEMRSTSADGDRLNFTKELNEAIERANVEMEKLKRVSENKIKETEVSLNVLVSFTRLMKDKY
jgi:bacterioferritin-associated ferredoxin